MRLALRRWWRWISVFLTMLFVLIACGQGDSPVSIRPPQGVDPVAQVSASDQSVTLMDAQSSFQVDYSIRSQWQDGFVADVTIQNLGDPIDGWTLGWIFASDQIRITNLWNGKLTQNGANVSVQDLGWNARIPSHGQIQFGFEASYRGTDVIPSAFTLNGISLGNPTPPPLPAACEVNYKIRTQWDKGFIADLQLRNLGDPVTNWELSWEFPVEGVQITNLWNGQVAQNGSEVTVTNLDWNATLDHQEQMDLGFNASHTGGGVTPTEFYLNGLLCNGLPASPVPTSDPGGSPQPSPGGSPQPTPGSSPTPPVEIPTNALIITNADEVDGTPLQVGQSLTLTAVAGDPQGQDISAQIQWTDQAGAVLATGPVLVYAAEEVKPETLTASVGSQQAKVSFTVSTPDVIVAPHVKVLPDAATDLVESLDLEQGVLRIRADLMLPTLRVGDVVLGATGTVPPVKIMALEQGEGVLSLAVEPALPKEVIERGAVTFEQTVDWSGNSGPVRLLETPEASFHIAGDLDPKSSEFVQAGEPNRLSLKAKAVSELEWRPTYTGSIQFGPSSPTGIEGFTLSHSSTISTSTAVRAEGNYHWKDRVRAYNFLPQLQQDVILNAGPIPLPIHLYRIGYLALEPNVVVNHEMQVVTKHTGTSFAETIRYNPSDADPWTYETEFMQGDESADITEETQIDGQLALAFGAHVGIDLFGQANSARELRFYLASVGQINVNGVEEINNNETLQGEIEGETKIEVYSAVDYGYPFITNRLQSPSSQEVTLFQCSPGFGIICPEEEADEVLLDDPTSVEEFMFDVDDFDPGNDGPGGGGLFILFFIFNEIFNPQPTPTPSTPPTSLPDPQPTCSPTPSPTPCDPPDYPGYCPTYWSQDNADTSTLDPPTCELPYLPPQKYSYYSYNDNLSRKKCYRSCPYGYQSHHIVQQKAVTGLICDGGQITYDDAPAVLLCGGSHAFGSPHDCANREQDFNSPREGWTLEMEFNLAESALNAASICASATGEQTQRFGFDETNFQIVNSIYDYFIIENKCSPSQPTFEVGLGDTYP